MNSKHRKTLERIFATPAPKGMPWEDIESLLQAIGAIVTEGSGSRVKYDKDGVTLALHRPHNPKTTRAYHIPLLREFLQKVGIHYEQ